MQFVRISAGETDTSFSHPRMDGRPSPTFQADENDRRFAALYSGDKGMLAVVGGLCLAAGVVIFQWAYIEHRRPRLPVWLRHEFVSMMMCLAMLIVMALGVSLFLQYFMAHGSAGLDAAEIGMLAATAVVSALVIAAMQRFWRRRRDEWALAGGSLREIPGASGPKPAPGRGSRRAA